MLALETNGLSKSFRGRKVVRGVDLRVPEHGVYGFLGPNGAGKTTVMRLALGLLRRDAGEVRLLGHDPAHERIAALSRVGAFIESPALYDHLSGRKNLDLHRRVLHLPASEVDRVLEVVDLTEAAKEKAQTYSLGMRQRLALARTLLGSPRLLMLDEPTNGLDPEGIVTMRNLVRDLPNRIEGTVFVSSHILSEVQQVADEVGLLRRGRLVAQCPLAELVGTGRVIRLRVGEPAKAQPLLEGAGFACEPGAEGGLDIPVAEGGEADARTAAAVKLLVDAKIAVFAAAAEGRTLEEVYRGFADGENEEEKEAA